MAKTRKPKSRKTPTLRIPKTIAEQAHLEEGDPIVIESLEGHVVLRPVEKALTLEELVAKITPENRHEELKWGLPVGREIVGW